MIISQGVGLGMAILSPILAALLLQLNREGQTGSLGRMFKVMATGQLTRMRLGQGTDAIARIGGGDKEEQMLAISKLA